MDDLADVLRRALDYPYESPGRSFGLIDGRLADPERVDPGRLGPERLLAYGANAAPAALAAKLGTAAGPVLGERIHLAGFDVVYSAHVSPYGAVPATIAASPGTEVEAFVLHLTAEQRLALDATEPNYEPGEVAGVPAYLSRHGPLPIEGSPAALAAIAARERRFPEMSQPAVLEHVRRRLAPELDLESFVAAAAADPAIARRWSERLRPS